MRHSISVKHSILLTLAYTAQFDYPLSTTELWLRLVGCRPTMAEFVSNLIDLTDSGFVMRQAGYWQIFSVVTTIATSTTTKRPTNDYQRIRKKRATYSSQKIDSFRPIINFARTCPWIAGLAITGSVAMSNAAVNDDVDVMVVTENNRLWLVRPVLIVLAFVYGRRRSWHGEEPNSWCFNLWLERRSLQLPENNRSLYFAYESCQADWIVSKGRVDWEFLQTNRWISELVPRLFKHALHTPTQYGYKQDSFRIPLLSNLVGLLNSFTHWLQLLYMRQHITTERVGVASAFFHPRDTEGQVGSGLVSQFKNW